MAQDIILETRGLTKAFKGFTAVSDVNLRVQRGSIHALIGPNGAGKTTCFNLLNGQIRPDAGQVLLNGADIAGRPPRAIARSVPSTVVARSTGSVTPVRHDAPRAIAPTGSTSTNDPVAGASNHE